MMMPNEGEILKQGDANNNSLSSASDGERSTASSLSSSMESNSVNGKRFVLTSKNL